MMKNLLLSSVLCLACPSHALEQTVPEPVGYMPARLADESPLECHLRIQAFLRRLVDETRAGQVAQGDAASPSRPGLPASVAD